MAKLGDLIVKIGADTRQINSELGKLRRNVKQTADNIKGLGQSMSMALTLPVAGLGLAAVKAAADLETMETQFVSLTGGAEQAGQMVDKLNKFAAATPYEIEGIASAARQLIAAGTDVNDVTNQLQYLGDIAAVSGVPIEEMAAIFAKVQAKGKVELENLNQLAERGIPIFTMLSEATGLLPSELGAGAVSVDLFNETLMKMSQEGGFAFGAMQNLSQTAAGKFSTAMDSLKMAAASLGEVLLPFATAAIEKVTELAEKFTALDKETKTVIVVIGGVVAAIGPLLMIFGTLSQSIVAMNGAYSILKIALKGATIEQLKLNAAALANPYVLVGAAVVAAGVAIYEMNKRSTDSREKVDELTESVKELTAAEAALAAQQALTAQQEKVRKLRDQYEALQGLRAQGDQFEQRMMNQRKQQAKDELANAEATLAGYEKIVKQKQSDAYWSGVATERLAQYANARKKALAPGDGGTGMGQLTTELDGLTFGTEEDDILRDLSTKASRMAEHIANIPNSLDLEEITAPLDEVFEDVEFDQVMFDQFIAAEAAAVQFQSNMENIMADIATNATALGGQFGAAFGQLLTGAEGGEEAMASFASAALDAGFQAATALAINAAGQTAAAAGPGAAIALPILITAGMALIRSTFQGITGFADGGIISGPTMGLVGEYPGAKSNPEVIAPLDKLRSMISDVSGGGHVVVTGRISGRDILISNERTARDAKRFR